MNNAELLSQRLSRRPLPRHLREKRPVSEADATRRITAPTLVYDEATSELVLAYLPYEEDVAELLGALRLLDIKEYTRTSGLPTRSRTFGFYPRDGRYHPRCGEASLARDKPETHELLVRHAAPVARLYERLNPALFARHARLARGVRPAWRLPATPFTGGIVNYQNPLPYHRDTANFAGVWSAMLGLRRDVRGGWLIVPDYDLAVEVADRTITLFDGYKLLHGVSPLERTSGKGYRFTIVYYSQGRMCDCLSPEGEAAR